MNKVGMRLSILRSVGELARINLKKGGFFVAKIIYFWNYDNGKTVDHRVCLESNDFELEFETSEGTIKRNQFSVSVKKIASVDKYSKVGGELFDDLLKVRKQCNWPIDLDRKASTSGTSKFGKSILDSEPTTLKFRELVEKGFHKYLDHFEPIAHELKAEYAFLAIEHNRTEVLKWILEKSKFELDKNLRADILVNACKKGNLSIIKHLVSNGFDINVPYSVQLETGLYEVYPIATLVEGVHVKSIEWIVENIENTKLSLTPKAFRDCCMAYNGEFSYELLIDLIPDSNHQDFLNRGLRAAVLSYKPEVVSDLLKRGADANYRPEGYGSMFISAIKKGHTPIVEELINHKIDLAKEIEADKTALEIASDWGINEIVDLISKSQK